MLPNRARFIPSGFTATKVRSVCAACGGCSRAGCGFACGTATRVGAHVLARIFVVVGVNVLLDRVMGDEMNAMIACAHVEQRSTDVGECLTVIVRWDWHGWGDSPPNGSGAHVFCEIKSL